MSERPAWKDEFPISWVDDHFVTRREFAKSLAMASCACFAATTGLTARAAAGRGGPFPEMRVATWDELPIGSAKVFAYPEEGEPCLLLRTGADTFVAFGQKCTHLGCPVLYERADNTLHCPCHEGLFSAADGRVLSGPPPRPLPRIALARRGEELWAVGIES